MNTAIPVLNEEAFRSLLQTTSDWMCPACSRKGMTHRPQRHDYPQEFTKRCRCGAEVAFFLGGSPVWHFTVVKTFRHRGRRWKMIYRSDIGMTFYSHGRADPHLLQGVVPIRRFKNLLVFT
jgi:hypothetical protein